VLTDLCALLEVLQLLNLVADAVCVLHGLCVLLEALLLPDLALLSNYFSPVYIISVSCCLFEATEV
jgi:hypothetical protein